jgi:hypothetical protein
MKNNPRNRQMLGTVSPEIGDVSRLIVKFLSVILCASFCLNTVHLFAGENNLPCDKCAKESEFSWNPDNQYVTPRLERFYRLEEMVRAAYESRDEAELSARANEYLDLASIYRCNWNYGNAVHDANRYLGLASLRSGNVEQAVMFLLRSGKSTGSPQLNSFGPDLNLAGELLKQGQVGPVRAYLVDVKRFWKMDNGQIDQWLAALERGERPELNRFAAMMPPLWMLLLWLVVITGPAIVALFLMYIGRRTLRRKVLFLFVAMSAGYVSLILLYWTIVPLMIRLVTTSELARNAVWLLTVCLPIILSLAVPAAVVFGVFRCFLASSRKAR